jgi:hypothetical protein
LFIFIFFIIVNIIFIDTPSLQLDYAVKSHVDVWIAPTTQSFVRRIQVETLIRLAAGICVAMVPVVVMGNCVTHLLVCNLFYLFCSF